MIYNHPMVVMKATADNRPMMGQITWFMSALFGLKFTVVFDLFIFISVEFDDFSSAFANLK